MTGMRSARAELRRPEGVGNGFPSAFAVYAAEVLRPGSRVCTGAALRLIVQPSVEPQPVFGLVRTEFQSNVSGSILSGPNLSDLSLEMDGARQPHQFHSNFTFCTRYRIHVGLDL